MWCEDVWGRWGIWARYGGVARYVKGKKTTIDTMLLGTFDILVVFELLGSLLDLNLGIC